MELVFELSEALVIDLLRGEVVFELLMELLHPVGQGGGALLAAAAFAAFGLQFGGGSCQGRDGGAEAAFELKELVLQGRLICARSRRRGGWLRALGLGASEVLGALGQALLQFVEAGFGFGSGLLLGAEPAIQLVAGLAGLRKLLFQLGAPGRLCFQGGRGLLGSGADGVKLLVLLLEMSPGALEVHSALTQPLLQFVEAGVRIGWSRLCGGSRLAQVDPGSEAPAGPRQVAPVRPLGQRLAARAGEPVWQGLAGRCPGCSHLRASGSATCALRRRGVEAGGRRPTARISD